jgi:hypothetical protein
MKIEDKAQTIPDIDLAAYSGARAYIILSDELVPADRLSPEGEFPKYGDFLHVMTTGGEGYIECPQALAAWLVEQDASIHFGFRIRTVTKDSNGEWVYDCEELTPEELEQLNE